MAQPRYADGAARDSSGEGRYQQEQQETVAGGPRPWEVARRGSLPGATGTGARGRGRLPGSPVRVARTLRLIVDEWGWPVVPGSFVADGMCSCGDPHCAEPGRHALSDASWLAATSDAERVRDRWRSHPEAAIVLPVGWCFDLLEVPERGGREAIGRLEAHVSTLPPVIATATGRLLFLVAALDRNAGDVAEASPLSPAPRTSESPRSAALAGRLYEDEDVRDAAAARDAAVARATVTELEPWPASSTWLASAAGCRPETSIWVGGGAIDAPDVVVRRSGLLVAPLLGPEPPGITRWLVPPTPTRRPLPRMEDVLGPIVHACRETAVRPSFGYAAVRRPEEPPRRPEGGPRPTDTVSSRGVETAPVRGPGTTPRRAAGAARGSEVVSDREAETAPVRGPDFNPDTDRAAAGGARPGTAPVRGVVWPTRLSDPARRGDLVVRRVEPPVRGHEPAGPSAGRGPSQGRGVNRSRSVERATKPVSRAEAQVRPTRPTWIDPDTGSSIRPDDPGQD